MATKSSFGKACECLVHEIITAKTGFSVENLNDTKVNHPVTDLIVKSLNGEVIYEVSVKAKDGHEWPSVKGIKNKDQYMVFVDFEERVYPEFYVLNYRQWNNVLKKILPKREKGAEIVDGAIEWNWLEGGKKKKRRGSLLRSEEIAIYRGKWSSLPVAT